MDFRSRVSPSLGPSKNQLISRSVRRVTAKLPPIEEIHLTDAYDWMMIDQLPQTALIFINQSVGWFQLIQFFSTTRFINQKNSPTVKEVSAVNRREPILDSLNATNNQWAEIICAGWWQVRMSVIQVLEYVSHIRFRNQSTTVTIGKRGSQSQVLMRIM